MNNFFTKDFNLIAGPCSIESFDMLLETALFLKENNVHFMRGGAFKPRTCSKSFQGLRDEGLKYIKEVKDQVDIQVVSEVMDPRHIESMYSIIDVFQIGARNMHNFELLKEIGKQDKPIILKRGLCATIDEFIEASNYIANEGNDNIILCERGIRSYDPMFRNTLDIPGALMLKKLTNYPVILDPSHGTGKPELISPITEIAKTIGLDGCMIEIHDDPKMALCDGDQALAFNEFKDILKKLRTINL